MLRAPNSKYHNPVSLGPDDLNMWASSGPIIKAMGLIDSAPIPTTQGKLYFVSSNMDSFEILTHVILQNVLRFSSQSSHWVCVFNPSCREF